MDDNLLNFPATSPPDYYRSTLPNPYDEQIRAFVSRTISRASDSQRSPFTADEAWMLLAYSRRMASLAVRRSSIESLRDAVAALLLEGGDADATESMSVIALLYDASARIQSDFRYLLDDVPSSAADGWLAKEMRAFPRRAPDDRTLDAWGFVTSSDADGFLYERRW